jgi:elongation factor Ts
MKDNCLLEQVFIKDTDKQIKDIVADVSKAAGAPLSVAAFVRFQLGQ